MRYPKMNAILCNNPYLRKIIRNPITGYESNADGFPTLVVEITQLPYDSLWEIEAVVYDQDHHESVALRSESPAENGNIKWTWKLDEPIENPWVMHLRVSQESVLFEQTIGLRIYRLYGKVTDFSGKPIEGIVCANMPGISTVSDKDGCYNLWLPDTRISSLLAMDVGFGTSSLECWVYDYWPREDLHLDMRVGQLELYELHAWRGFTGIKIDVIPMSVGIVNVLFGEGKEPGHLESVGPDLNPSDISVELDGSPKDIFSMDRREEITAHKAADRISIDSRPEYSLQIADISSSSLPFGSLQILRVAIRHHLRDGGQDIIEQGEGFYLGLRNGITINSG